MIRHRLSRQEGSALAIAVTLMGIMLTIGLAMLAFVDTETEASRKERIHEARLNLTEGVIAAELFLMSRDWPSNVDSAYPESCTQTSNTAKCPDPTQVNSHFDGVDFAQDPSWNVQVRDNGTAGPYYSDALVLGQPTWDRGGPAGATTPDGEMWIRAEGRLEGSKRVLVARVRVEQKPLNPPQAAFIAGKFKAGNSGNKVIVVSNGKPGVVRCDDASAPSQSTNGCRGYDIGQVSDTVTSDINAPSTAISPGLMEVLKQTAINNGTYYETCPTNVAQYSGDVVYVKSGACSVTSGAVINGVTKKGMFIIESGTLTVKGNITWYGLLYGMNLQGCGTTPTPTPAPSPCINNKGYTDTVIDLSGNTDIQGAVFVDGPGRFLAGESKLNLTYNPNSYLNITAYGTAGIIQNTWREVIAN